MLSGQILSARLRGLIAVKPTQIAENLPQNGKLFATCRGFAGSKVDNLPVFKAVIANIFNGFCIIEIDDHDFSVDFFGLIEHEFFKF